MAPRAMWLDRQPTAEQVVEFYRDNARLERGERIMRMFEQWPLVTLATIGDALGLTRERIRQLREAADPTGERLQALKHVRRRIARGWSPDLPMGWDLLVWCAQEVIKRNRERGFEPVPCAMCKTGWAIRAGTVPSGSTAKRTCSPECARTWAQGGRFLDDEEYEKHRRQQWASIMRNPMSATPSQRKWAWRIFWTGKMPPANRRFVKRNSELARVKQHAHHLRGEEMVYMTQDDRFVTEFGIRWEEPPPRKRRDATDWDALFAELRTKPGEWARLATFHPKDRAYNAANRLRQKYSPDYEFAARTDGTDKTTASLYGRFILVDR